MCIHVITVTSDGPFQTQHQGPRDHIRCVWVRRTLEHWRPKKVDRSIQFKACHSQRIVCRLLFSPANIKIVYHSPSSEAYGSQSGRREKRHNKSFEARVEEPLGTDSHRTISKRQSNVGSWLCTKNALYYCTLSANSIDQGLFTWRWGTQVGDVTHLVGVKK